MPDFAIIDPKAGMGENNPSVTLPDAFLAKCSENVHFRYGRYDKMRGRLPLLVDSEAVKIAAPTDIFAIASLTSTNLIGQWRMNDNADNKVVEDSAADNDGAAQQNTEDLSVAGLINEALAFNGSSDRIEIGNLGILNFGGAAFSIVSRFKISDTHSDNNTIFAKSPAGVGSTGYVLYVESTGKVIFRTQTGGATTNLTSAATYDDGVWHTVAAVYNGDGTGVLYVDDTIVTGSLDSGDMDNAWTARIGSRSGSTGWFFKGDIDDTRVYDEALSQEEYTLLYNGGDGTEKNNNLINIVGDHSAGATPLSAGDIIRVNGGTEAENNLTFTVDSLPTTSSIVTIELMLDARANKGNVFVGSTPVIEYHKHIKKGTGTEHLLLGTKYHILLWLQVDLSMAVKFTVGDEGGSPAGVERWEIKDHLRNVVATNNSDRVIWWDVDDTVANDFEVLDQANGIDYQGSTTRLTKCKHLTSYETYLILGYTTENGTVHPQRERWASLGTGGADIDFDENGSGDAGAKDFFDSPGFLMGFAIHGNDLVIAKEDSMHRSWSVEADTVFVWEEYTLKVGCVSADSLVNDKAGRLYWIGSDLTIREINTALPISTAVDITVKGLNTAQAEFIQATFIDEFEEVWFAIPGGNSDTNDTVVSFHPDSGRSHIYKFPIRAFGDFTQQEAFTYDTLPYGTYTAWGSDWLIYDTSRNVVGFPLDVASDYSGNSFALHRADKDDGEDFFGILILSTTLTNPKSLNVFKRINNGCDLIYNRKSSGSVALSLKRDTERNWQSVGEASLVDADGPETVIVHVPFDERAKSFLIRQVSAAVTEFIGAVFREFEFDGSR